MAELYKQKLNTMEYHGGMDPHYIDIKEYFSKNMSKEKKMIGMGDDVIVLDDETDPAKIFSVVEIQGNKVKLAVQDIPASPIYEKDIGNVWHLGDYKKAKMALRRGLGGNA